MRRVALLVLTLAAGTAVGLIGQAVSGSSTWYLALPAALAAVWLKLADPTRCEAPPGGLSSRQRPSSAQHTDEA